MIKNVGYVLIFGLPLIFYLGIITLLSFLFTASISILNVEFNIHKIPFKWHPRMAKVSIALALIHGLLSILLYL